MDRGVRHVVVIGIAMVTAALASFGVYLTLKRMPVREVEVARTFVVVAARALPTGVRLAAADLKVVPWPASSMLSGAFAKVDDVVERGLLSSVVENEPLIESKLAPREAGAGLSSTIPQGMRAMSVKVNDVIGVAGFLDSGTRVDLLVTIRRKDDSTSRTVASNVQVLTSGTRGDQQRPKDAKPTSSSLSTTVVTLLVTPEDAERIALAQAEGQIMLSLRNPLDSQPTASRGVRTEALFGKNVESEPVVKPVSVRRPTPPPPPAPVAAPPPEAKAYTVEAIRAAKRSEEVVH
jgi:pilus assembly protein CpaB